MIQLTSLILTLLAVLVYFKLKRNANKKYGDSVTFQIIDREYNKWYRKRRNGFVINKNTISMFEVDKVIWKLRNNLVSQGINQEQLNDYISFLKSDSPKSYGLKGIIVSILSFFGIQNVIENVLKNSFTEGKLFDSKSLENFSSNISSLYSKYAEIIQLVIISVLLITLIILCISVMYIIANMDSLYKDSQRNFVLNRINDIWNFKENDEVRTIEEAIKESESNKEQIFIDLPYSKSKIDEDINNAIGNSCEYNFQFVKKLKLLSWINLPSFKEWILGELFPSLFNFLTLVVTFYTNHLLLEQRKNIYYLMLVPTLILAYLYFVFYLSQIDKLEEHNQADKVKIEEAKNMTYNLETRKDMKIRTWFACIFQLLITVTLSIILYTVDKFSIEFSSCLIFFPIILLILITVFGLFKKVVFKKITPST